MAFLQTTNLMSRRFFAFVTVLLFVAEATAQYRQGDYNTIGITGGAALFDINTSDLNTKQRTGFVGTLSNRGAFYNWFDFVWEIGFVQSELEVLAWNAEQSGKEYIGYNMQSGQLKLLASYVVKEHLLSLEFGPVLNVNGKLNLDDEDDEGLILDGYNGMTTDQIQDITKINFRLQGGLTVGVRHFRLSAQYQYGVTNVLNNLNSQGLENEDLKGHTSTILLMGIIYF